MKLRDFPTLALSSDSSYNKRPDLADRNAGAARQLPGVQARGCFRLQPVLRLSWQRWQYG